MEFAFILLFSHQAVAITVMATAFIINDYKCNVKYKFEQRLRDQLEKNREWYKEDKTITYEVNPMFNKLCQK